MTQSDFSFVTASKKPAILDQPEAIQGIAIAITILSVWALSLTLLMQVCVNSVPLWRVGLFMFWQTFLYTGLFITAHDAMHGAIAPHHPRINRLFGTVSLRLYGLFSYQEMLQKHRLHHQHPSTELDPDFHDGNHSDFFRWYLHFMQRYWSWTRLIGLIVIFHFFHHLLHIPERNLLLFWIIPSLLSSAQLFYFGTFLTHREPVEGYHNAHRAQSMSFPVFWSFLTCYHFGYHHEHHQYPHLPWWKLPQAHSHDSDYPSPET